MIVTKKSFLKSFKYFETFNKIKVCTIKAKIEIIKNLIEILKSKKNKDIKPKKIQIGKTG